MSSSDSCADTAAPGAARRRHELWDDLRAVARPDSRFHLRFSAFIPDFEGSDEATRRLLERLEFGACPATPARAAPHLMVTPDNSLTGLRQRLIEAGCSVVVPSYNLARGFRHFAPGAVAPTLARYAAWLDGVEHFGAPVSLSGLALLGRFDAVVTGSSAVALSGVRFGRGHGYFDLEWRLFAELGLVDERTPVATLVHDLQVLERPLMASPDDVPVDLIATPTRVLSVSRPHARPRRVDWTLVDEDMVAAIPPLADLRRSLGLAAPVIDAGPIIASHWPAPAAASRSPAHAPMPSPVPDPQPPGA
jgi:5-formyltetrahydrofolate cyclo-ligase